MDPVLCVPMMPRATTTAYIHNIIRSLDIGEIDDIRSCYTHVPPECKRVFIHLKTWYHTVNGLKVRRMLLDKKTLKVIHDGFKCWKVTAMRN